MSQPDADRSEPTVLPLENTAHFSIDDDGEGYVTIEQSRGDQVAYTPDEARDVAAAILDAAETAERRVREEAKTEG